ncbi:MAG TPA: redoxin family protein [Rhabdochlamydiaceae bacterium]|nr:redoxin family protein [Rhabdochlamydiaceae bacterium]
MSQITPTTGLQWAGYRTRIMPDPIKIGEKVPDVHLSRLAQDGKTVIHFSTGKELSEGPIALFCVSKAFSTLSDESFSEIVKAANTFKKLNVKLFCVAVNTRTEMFAWGQQNHPAHKVNFIPDFAGDFVFSLGIGMDKSVEEHEGFVAKRAAIFLHNGKVMDIQVELDSKISAENFLKRILPILEANHLHCNEKSEGTGTLEISKTETKSGYDRVLVMMYAHNFS